MSSGSAEMVFTSGDADDPTAVLTQFRASQTRVRREEAVQLGLAARFASFYEVDRWQGAASLVEPVEEVPGSEGELLLGGDGCPWVSEFAVAEFAAATGRSTRSGRLFLAQAVELVHRLPLTWAAVAAGRVEGWRARRIAEATMTLSRQAAGWVDAQVHSVAQAVGVARLDRLVEEALARFDPEQLLEDEQDDLGRRHVEFQIGSSVGGRAVTSRIEAVVDTDDALALKTVLDEIADQLTHTGDSKAVRMARAVGMLARGEVLFNHPNVSRDGVAVTVEPPTLQMVVRAAEGDTLATVHSLTGQRLGMVSINQLQTWAGHSKLIVKPVLDLNVEATSQGRFPSRSVREQVIETNRQCVFPHCERPAEACDVDHINPWVDPDNGGPPDQTRTGNLAPLCRHHHRVKTHTGWRYRQIEPGVHEWTSPHGLSFHIDRGGTTDVTDHRGTG